MTATFRVDRSFAIKGRGLVIAGQIASGTIKVGGMIPIPDSKGTSRSRIVTSVEKGNGLDPSGQVKGLVGLVLGKLPPPELAAAQRYLATGLILTVSDPEPGAESLFPGPDHG